MSYLTEPPSFELDPAQTTANNNATSTSYDYHLPHTKTIDLIGEEFAPKSRSNVVVESINQPTGISSSAHNLGANVVLVNTSNSGPVPLHVQQIIQQAQNQVSDQSFRCPIFYPIAQWLLFYPQCNEQWSERVENKNVKNSLQTD